VGTVEGPADGFSRPYRDASYSPANPALEAPGYFQASLRDVKKALSRESLMAMFTNLVL
jgi:hypothetical protein